MIQQESLREKDDILIPAQHALKMVGRAAKPENTIINMDGIRIGGAEIVAMAGPCSVEGEQQLMATAQAEKALKSRILPPKRSNLSEKVQMLIWGSTFTTL